MGRYLSRERTAASQRERKEKGEKERKYGQSIDICRDQAGVLHVASRRIGRDRVGFSRKRSSAAGSTTVTRRCRLKPGEEERKRERGENGNAT